MQSPALCSRPMDVRDADGSLDPSAKLSKRGDFLRGNFLGSPLDSDFPNVLFCFFFWKLYEVG